MIRSVNSPKRDHCGIARQYEQDIVAGRIPLCEIGRQAIDRQIRDMRTYAESGDYIFSVDEGNRVCKFIELLTHTKGPLKGQRIKLEPWQCWILTTIFGWRRRSDGGRRFRRVYIEVPRGNGKSCLSSGVALYCLLADREPGAEVYSFATTRDQAGIVFGDAKQMCMQSPELREHFGLQVLAKALYVPGTNSTFQAKSAEGSTLDGLKTHFACIDELHAHKTRAVYDVVRDISGYFYSTGQEGDFSGGAFYLPDHSLNFSFPDSGSLMGRQHFEFSASKSSSVFSGTTLQPAACSCLVTIRF